MAVSTLTGRLLNDGTLGPPVALGDLFNTYGTGHDPLTTWASALDTAMAAITTCATAVATCATAINLVNRTQTLTTATCLEGTNANTWKTTATCTYVIDGVVYSKAATDNLAFTAAAQQADNTDCLYTLCLDTSGTASTVKGTAAATGAALSIPAPTAGTCAIGHVKVALSGGTFTAGSTDLSGTGVTATFVNYVGADPALAVTATTAIATLTTAVTTMNTAIRTTLNAALVGAIPAAL